LIALYARVSTRDKNQNPETQLIQLREWARRQGAEFTEYVDLASGKDLNRPAWKDLTKDWRRGKIDAIAITRIDRAFRSSADMHNVTTELERRGIRFAIITSPIDTGTPSGKMLNSILAAFAEFERDMISARVKEGLARAKRDGKKLGRPKARLSPERAARVLDEHEGDAEQAAKSLGVSKATFYRRLKKVG